MVSLPFFTSPSPRVGAVPDIFLFVFMFAQEIKIDVIKIKNNNLNIEPLV